jgi:hypothetical protein
METPFKVLIDLNIILDTLQRREPHYADSASVRSRSICWSTNCLQL